MKKKIIFCNKKTHNNKYDTNSITQWSLQIYVCETMALVTGNKKKHII